MLLSLRAAGDIAKEVGIIPPISELRVFTDDLLVGLTPGTPTATSSLILTLDSPQVALTADPPFAGSVIAVRTDSLQLTGNAAGLKPIVVDVQVRLVAALMASTVVINTGPLNISLTSAGQPAFLFSRDLVIAGQSEFPDGSINDAVLLGVQLTDPDFASVDNDGELRQPNAGDIQFMTLPGNVELSHNVITHDTVNGRIIFDLKLPTWNPHVDFFIRMNYGTP